MSYRTTIEDFQIFGNNETYPEWLEFIKSQGITIDEDGNYSGEISDYMGMLITIENIVLRLEKEKQQEIENLRQEEIQAKNSGKETRFFEETLHNPESRYYKRSMFDLSNIYRNIIKDMNQKEDYMYSLYDHLFYATTNFYMFMPYSLYQACKNKLEECKPFSTPNHFYCYKLKTGETIHVEAS